MVIIVVQRDTRNKQGESRYGEIEVIICYYDGINFNHKLNYSYTEWGKSPFIYYILCSMCKIKGLTIVKRADRHNFSIISKSYFNTDVSC